MTGKGRSHRSVQPPGTDRPTDDRGQAAPRASRIAAVIAGASASPEDYRSVDALLKAARATIAVSHSTFCRWCVAEGLRSKDVVDFARVLRGLRLAAEWDCPISEVLEIDVRTLPALLGRGGVRDLVEATSLTAAEFCRRQRYVRNRFVVAEVLRLIETWADRR